MDPSHRLTRRERAIRIGSGVGLVVLGCVVFTVSKRLDPANRAAWLGIISILAGMSFLGQGVRGHRDLAVPREPPPAGPPISAERTVGGILGAWLVPGLGHFLIGQRAKALLYFLTITLTFVLGIALAEGRNLSYERDGVYFLAYMFNGVETGLGWLLTHRLEPTHEIRFLHLGFLYSAVACLLNLVAMMDFVAICSRSVGADAEVAATTAAATVPEANATEANADAATGTAGPMDVADEPESREGGGA
jgi:hypothetical protein